MAFTSSTFSLVSYSGNGFHIWHYKSDDAATAIDAAGYFNTYAKEINAGDVIFVVSSNDGTTVDVNNISAATSDSD